MSICYIVGAGPYSGEPFHPSPDDFVIAADGGYAFLTKHSIRCDLLVGDFDSMPDPGFANTIKLNPVKDDTDTVYAVKEALSRGYDDFRIYGALGGRFDQSIASVQTLSYIVNAGARGYLLGDGFAASVIRNSRLDFRAGLDGFFSVFSLSDESKGVFIEGAKYPLQDAVLTNTFPLGVSNEFLGEKASVSVCEGELLILFNCEKLEKAVYQC